MAKTTNKRSGFDAPVYGNVLPKGSTFKKDKNGKMVIVPAEKASAKKKKK